MGRGQNGGTQTSSSRDMKMFLKNRMWREHWYVIVAVGAIVVTLFGSAFLQFSTSQDHVYRLEVTDSVLMERVFRSGEPWVVLCSRPDDELPGVFDKVSTRLVGKSYVGVLDCTQTLPDSGKSVFKRYDIKRSISPTVFTVANGEKPKQVFLNHLQSTKALAKHVKAQTKKMMKQKFNPYEKQWIDKLMREHRTLSFAWMDSTSLKFSLEKMLPDVRRREHRMVLFRRQRDLDTNKKTVLAAKAFRGVVFDAMPVGMFLDENVHSDSLKPLSKPPKISRRKKSEASKATRTEEKNQRQSRHKHRHQRKERDEEQSDDHFFPQEVEIDDDGDVGSIVFDDVEEDEEVLDLDDDE
ncbi:hypothetical protein G195_002441 [Phytophthora kernoviae 00238/432]|uniref:Thioredoxin domain-containing protein n=1 Tax=Phytophthora kernoviae 00238/432 TaxID=1284355 RepID=A0A8J4WAP0_9STRA|nr:hypothetical protein G195_002441 [Phytophthora kernoviae 00238/432]